MWTLLTDPRHIAFYEGLRAGPGTWAPMITALRHVQAGEHPIPLHGVTPPPSHR